MLLGAIAGDIIGSPYELPQYAITSKEFPLFVGDSHYTGDTVMTLAVAEGLMQGWGNAIGVRECIIDAMHTLGGGYPLAGYGPRFSLWLSEKRRVPYDSCGNGTAMRVSAMGWAFTSLEDTERYAALSAAVSHNHPEGIKGACAVAVAIFLARTGHSKTDIAQCITQRYGYNLTQDIDGLRAAGEDMYPCQKVVPCALICCLQGTDYEDSLRNAVSLGNDSDTLAAICGSIAAPMYGGVPPHIAQQALSRLDAPLQALIERWNMWRGVRLLFPAAHGAR